MTIYCIQPPQIIITIKISVDYGSKSSNITTVGCCYDKCYTVHINVTLDNITNTTSQTKSYFHAVSLKFYNDLFYKN